MSILKTVVPVTHDLGGFQVRRAIPSPNCRMVGPFVFVDQFGPARLAPDYPRLHAVRDAVAEIDGIAAYLASERRIPFNEDGLFRRYPELDAA